MQTDDLKARVRAQVWESLATSRVRFEQLSQAELQALVSALVDGVLVAVGEGLRLAQEGAEEVRRNVAVVADQAPEVTLWKGRPFLSLVRHYEITSQRIRATRGLLGKEREDVELFRVVDSTVRQTAIQRVLGIGDVIIRSSDATTPELILDNIFQPDEVHELVRQAVLRERSRRGMTYQEELERTG